MSASKTDKARLALATIAPLEAVQFSGLAAGPRLLVLGAVHGNEVCGPNAIRKAIAACRAGEILIRRGEVTFVPVSNPKAYAQGTREGDRNLNRDLRETPIPTDFEARVGNRLCDLLRRHEVLLDIHSFGGEGTPFVFFGPEDNGGEMEPFRHARYEGAFATALGTKVAIHGWLESYARLLAERERIGMGGKTIAEGYGTTEFMRFNGGYGTTIECGTHGTPEADELAYAAILNGLAHLGLVDQPAPAPKVERIIHMIEPIVCLAAGDRLEGSWRTADPIAAGTPIARRANGETITAPRPGFIIFPKADAKPGEPLCYFGVPSERKV